jgi:hypothetical protein
MGVFKSHVRYPSEHENMGLHISQESAMVTMLIDTWQCIDGVCFIYM